jgi:uncharacterized protein
MDRAEQTFQLFRDHMDQNPFGTASLLGALDFYLSKPKEIVVVGSRTDPRVNDLLSQIHGRYLPNKTLVVVNEKSSGAIGVPAVAQDKTAIEGMPTVYVCHNFTCSQPVTQWDALEKLL